VSDQNKRTDTNPLVRTIKAGRKVSVPIFAITTPDQAAVERLIRREINGDAPQFGWDIVRGLSPRRKADATLIEPRVSEETKHDPVAFLKACDDLPANSLVFMHSASRFLQDTEVTQALLNLRDEFKVDRRTLILLGPSLRLPEELVGSVVEIDDPLPDDIQLAAIVREQLESVPEGQLEFEPTDDLIRATASELKGTMAFGAEQCSAMALRKSGFDQEFLNTSARKLIEQTKGLTFETGRETFDDIGGLDFAKRFATQLADGPEKPIVIVRVEELEKAMAGSTGGDLSGTSSDALQVFLSEMEDNDWSGMLAFGPAGAGKSLYAKAFANSTQAKALRFDVNATKGSLVGESEAAIRAAMKTLRTIGGRRVFFIASVNRLESLPPELQRRFRCGVWFFDLPNKRQRETIWQINRERYGLPAGASTKNDAEDLTGADIRNLCEMAHRLGCSVAEARDYVVPLKVQSPRSIQDCRQQATGRFIDATEGGVYEAKRRSVNAGSRKRKINYADH